MNSVLQSLVHTPPLAELLLSGGSGCLHNGAVNGCYPIALAQELVSCSLARTTRSPLSPLKFAMALRRISRRWAAPSTATHGRPRLPWCARQPLPGWATDDSVLGELADPVWNAQVVVALASHPMRAVGKRYAPRCHLCCWPTCCPSCSFRLGRQEDAHEFLIALLDAMHEASIAGMSPKPPPELAHTSFIYRIFGGRMRSQVNACSDMVLPAWRRGAADCARFANQL